MDYLIQGTLDNTVHTISYDQLRILYEDNRKEAEESRRITCYRPRKLIIHCPIENNLSHLQEPVMMQNHH